MSAEQVKVTVNGQELQVEKGARLIDVCRENGYPLTIETRQVEVAA